PPSPGLALASSARCVQHVARVAGKLRVLEDRAVRILETDEARLDASRANSRRGLVRRHGTNELDAVRLQVRDGGVDVLDLEAEACDPDVGERRIGFARGRRIQKLDNVEKWNGMVAGNLHEHRAESSSGLEAEPAPYAGALAENLVVELFETEHLVEWY